MNNKEYKLPEDVINEPGVSDATFQDFIAPLLAGLGVGKVALAGGSAVVKAPQAARPLVAGLSAAKQAVEKRAPIAQSVEDVLSQFQTKAQEIGDFARVFKYKALRSALEQSQLTPEEILGTILKIHADVNPIVKGLQ